MKISLFLVYSIHVTLYWNGVNTIPNPEGDENKNAAVIPFEFAIEIPETGKKQDQINKVTSCAA